jgi:hypothetical protein
MTGLPAWWPVSGMRGWMVGKGTYSMPEEIVVPLDDGQLGIGVRESISQGRRVGTLRERVVVRVQRSPGFSLEELEQGFVTPMRALVAIGVDEPVSVFNLRVDPEPDPAVDAGSGGFVWPFDVDPHDGEEPEEIDGSAPAPLPLSPSVEDMGSFIPAWLTVARRFFVPLATVEPQQRRAPLHLQFLDVVNAAETLHRLTHPAPEQHPFADKVAEALKETGKFNAKERRQARDAISVFVDVTLEKRLLDLAEELGPEPCAWLFDGAAAAWAFVTARIRNILAHGLVVSHSVHEDFGALAVALLLTEGLITLRLLNEAGLPSGDALIERLVRHRGMRALAGQTIADWAALAHHIDPDHWPDPAADPPEKAPGCQGVRDG